MAMIDLRRKDERFYEFEHPFWVKSAPILPEHVGGQAVLISFPMLQKGDTWLHTMFFQVEQVFDGTPALAVGLGSIPLESTTDGGVVTVVGATHYLNTTSIAPTVVGNKVAANAETWVTSLGKGGELITGLDIAVPVIYGALTGGGTITTGSGRLYMLVSKAR